MMRSDNAGPQDPRKFLEELKLNSMRENEQESLAPLDQAQPTTSSQEPQASQDRSAAITALALFSNKVQKLIFDVVSEMREAQRHRNDLSEENNQMRLTIGTLNDTVAARDAQITELTATIETLRENAKLQTA
jgi:chromosome segregation ATPase